MTKSSIYIALIIIVFGLLSIVWWTGRGGPEGPISCTMDAKICPDGSVVGRTGPLCEFAACPSESSIERASLPDLIDVHEPAVQALLSGPFDIRGQARGYWFFEASFPVSLYDAKGKLLGVAVAQAEEDWMTEDFVPFSTTMVYDIPTTETGTLVFEKDNPSGLPEFDNSLEVPVRFTVGAPLRTVTLYHYDQSRDRDEVGNVMCTQAGLVPVERAIPFTNTPLEDTIHLLLKGTRTMEELRAGMVSHFPLEGLILTGISSRDGVYTLAFNDPLYKTSGGACFVSILRAQVEMTARQFPGVQSVTFTPSHLFQP